jgi:hypothetical protein
MSDGKEIPEGTKVRFVVDEEELKCQENKWHSIHWTIDGVQVESKLNWSKVLGWVKEFDKKYWSKPVRQIAGEGYWWYWERVRIKDDWEFFCRLWVSRTSKKYPPADITDQMVHHIIIYAPYSGVAVRSLRSGRLLSPDSHPLSPCLDGVNVVELN